MSADVAFDEFEHGRCHAELERRLEEHLLSDHTASDHVHELRRDALAAGLRELAAEEADEAEDEAEHVDELEELAAEAAPPAAVTEPAAPAPETAPNRVHPMHWRIGG